MKYSPGKGRARFLSIAKQMELGIPLSAEQQEWLRTAMLALATPHSDPAEILGLKYGRGQSYEKDEAARKMDIVMHYISCAVSDDASHLKDPEDSVPPMSLENALEEGSKLAKRLFEVPPEDLNYDKEYIRKCWYQLSKEERNNIYREEDWPYT